MALTVNNKPNTQKITIAKGRTPIFPSVNPQPVSSYQAQKPVAIPHISGPAPAPASKIQIQGSGSSNFGRLTPQQIIAEAARQADIARIAAIEQKQKLHTLKEATVEQKKQGFMGAISKKIGLSGFTAGRSKRERAVRLLMQNQEEAALYIQAKTRQFEREKAARQKYLIDHQDDPNFGKLLDEANAWADSQSKTVAKLATDYTKAQKDLYQFGGSKVSGTASKLLGTGYNVVNKAILKPVSKAWNAFTWTASQPGRGLNTALNFINPNRLRTYYGGTESSRGVKTGGSPFTQLKSAYNLSKNQRIIGRSKADEAARLRDFYFNAKDQNGKPLRIHHKPDSFFAKFGDDIANLIADPINALPVAWASKLGKASKLKNLANPLFKFAGKANFSRELVLRAGLSGDTKLGRFSKYLGSVADSTKRDRFYADNRSILDRRKSLVDEIVGHSQAWKADKFAAFSGMQAKLGGLDAQTNELLQRYMLNKNFGTSKFPDTVKRSFSWDGVNVPRGFSKAKRQQIEDLARSIKSHTDWLHGQDIAQALGNKKQLRSVYGAYRKSYLPQYKPKGGGATPSMTSSAWWLKPKKYQTLQSPDELLKSLRVRTYGTIGNNSFSKTWLKLHRDEYSNEISSIDRVLNVRSSSYKPNKLDRAADFNRASKPYRPLSLWRKSVLLLRPAWYVNNALWNIPAAISAGGARAIPELAKMTFSRKYRAATSELTAPARSRISNEVGRRGLSRFATAIEDIPRSAAFKASLDKGLPPEAALRRTNDWLFNYSNKRFEQPIRNVLPFYNWTKGLTKLALKMPFKYPRHANFYSKLYQQFYENPQSQLDNTTRTWVDEKGETHVSNERDKFKGKLYLYTDKSGNQHWTNTPFNALTPEQLGQINMNPLLVLGKMASASRDRYGNITTNRSLAQLGAEQFPQAGLFNNFLKRNSSSFDRWFSKSGYSKEAQGQDRSANNYQAGLDQHSKFWKSLDAFLGKPSTIIRDPKAAAYNKRYTDFNSAYFAIDWDKRINDLLAADPTSAYDKWNADKQALAKKYGFDFKRDIVHGGWQKYDTATTKRTKALKESAAAFMDSYWKEYKNLPKPQFIKTAKGGYYTPSTARPFWIEKFKQWRNQDTFAENPYLKLPYYNQKDAAGKPTGQKNYIDPYKLKQEQAASESKRAAGAQRYAAGQAKYALWQKYFNLHTQAQRQAFLKAHPGLTSTKGRKASPYQFDGKFFKSADTMQRYIDAKDRRDFFAKYFATSDMSERQRLLAENPKFNLFGDPSKIGFEAFRANKTAAGRLKGRNLRGFSALEAKYLADIRGRVGARTPISIGKRLAFKLR